jgi:hypothetical protein
MGKHAHRVGVTTSTRASLDKHVSAGNRTRVACVTGEPSSKELLKHISADSETLRKVFIAAHSEPLHYKHLPHTPFYVHRVDSM